MKTTKIAAMVGVAGLIATGAWADHLTPAYKHGSLTLNPGQEKTYILMCDPGSHVTGKGGAYVVKHDGSITPYNDPMLQQVPCQMQDAPPSDVPVEACVPPVWDDPSALVGGIQFGLIGGAKTENVVVWLPCEQDNNSY